MTAPPRPRCHRQRGRDTTACQTRPWVLLSRGARVVRSHGVEVSALHRRFFERQTGTPAPGDRATVRSTQAATGSNPSFCQELVAKLQQCVEAPFDLRCLRVGACPSQESRRRVVVPVEGLNRRRVFRQSNQQASVQPEDCPERLVRMVPFVRWRGRKVVLIVGGRPAAHPLEQLRAAMEHLPRERGGVVQ